MFNFFKKKKPVLTEQSKQELEDFLDTGDNFNVIHERVRKVAAKFDCTEKQASDLLLKGFIEMGNKSLTFQSEVGMLAYKTRQTELGIHDKVEPDVEFLAAREGMFVA